MHDSGKINSANRPRTRTQYVMRHFLNAFHIFHRISLLFSSIFTPDDQRRLKCSSLINFFTIREKNEKTAQLSWLDHRHLIV